MSCFLFLCKYCFCKRCFIRSFPRLFRSFSDLSRGFSGIFQISLLGFSGHVVLFRELLHLYLALLRCKDDFFRPDSSPACSFLPQGLSLPLVCIPSSLFSSTRMISIGQIHPQPALFLHKDDFFQPDSSPACFFLPQII